MNRSIYPFLTLCILFSTVSLKAQISITTLGSTYSQDFNGMSTSGKSATMPSGWYFSETGSKADKNYRADDGTQDSSDTYSFGSTSSSDRALGSISGSNNISRFGAAFTNNTGAAVTAVDIELTVEQWRLGASGRADSSVCELSVFASSIDLGFYQSAPQLNLVSPVTSGTPGPLDGNKSANQVTLNYTISGVSVPDGTTVWIRWTDVNISGDNDGLAIDNFKFTSYGTPPKPEISFATTALDVKEDADSFLVELKIKYPDSNPTRVNMNIDLGTTATVDDDFEYVSGTTFTFPANSSANIPVWIKVIDDKLIEPKEYINLNLTSPTNGAKVRGGNLIVTIIDNDTTETYKVRTMKFPQAAGVPDTTVYGYLHAVVTSGQFTRDGLRFFMSDSTGNIEVRAEKALEGTYTPAPGDSVLIRGKVQSMGFQTYIRADSIYLKSKNNAIPAFKTFANPNDTLESGLVRAPGLEWNNIPAWDTTVQNMGGMIVSASDGSGKNYQVFISNNSDLYKSIRPKYPFNLRGVLFQNSTNLNNGYFIWARSSADIEEIILPEYKISQITKYNVQGVADSIATYCWLKGEVQSGNYTSTGLDFYLIDNTGGLNVSLASGVSSVNYTPVINDSIMVRGRIAQYNGLTRIEIDSLRQLPKSSGAITPKNVTMLDEATEGELVILKDMRIVPADTGKWKPLGGSFSVRLYNAAKDTLELRIDNDVDLFNLPRPRGKMDVTGIGSQFDNTLPYMQGYYLLPRNAKDIVITGLDVEERKISAVKVANTDGELTLIGQNYMLKGVVNSGNFSSMGLWFSMEDNTGAITVWRTTAFSSYSPAVDDSIKVYGTIGQINGLAIIQPDSVIKMTGGKAGGPKIVTTMDETTESDLITIEKLSLRDPNEWDTTATGNKEGFVVRVVNDKGAEFRMRISRTTDIYATPAPAFGFHATGICSQDDTTKPYDSGYLLMPRSAGDLQILSSIEDGFSNGQLRVFPNPANDLLNITSTEGNIGVITIMDLHGRNVISMADNRTNATHVNIAALPAGVYILKVVKNNMSSHTRIVKH